MVSPETIQQTIRRYFAVNNTLDVEGFVNMFAADATLYNVAETPLVGLDAVRQIAEQTLTPYQASQVTIDHLFIIANEAAVAYTGSLTTKDGRSANVAGIDVFEINEAGKIQSLRFFFDPAPILALFGD